MFKQIDVTDIRGFRIGNAEDSDAGTGCTVIISEKGATAGVDVRGGGPATRETDLLRSENMIEKIHAVVISGGSAFGLEAGSGVMRELEDMKIGFRVGDNYIPIVCQASLYDLDVGQSDVRPDRTMGIRACHNAYSGIFRHGNYGAGTGASVGKFYGMSRAMKTGLGTFACSDGEIAVGAITAVNAFADVRDGAGNLIAGLLSADRRRVDGTIRPLKNCVSAGSKYILQRRNELYSMYSRKTAQVRSEQPSAMTETEGTVSAGTPQSVQNSAVPDTNSMPEQAVSGKEVTGNEPGGWNGIPADREPDSENCENPIIENLNRAYASNSPEISAVPKDIPLSENNSKETVEDGAAGMGTSKSEPLSMTNPGRIEAGELKADDPSASLEIERNDPAETNSSEILSDCGMEASPDTVDRQEDSEALSDDDMGYDLVFNTTISCLITNAKLTKAQCNKLASILHDGYARSIKPVHSMMDGDAIFVMTTGEAEVNFDAFAALATDIVQYSIIDGALSATSAYGLPCAAEILRAQDEEETAEEDR